MLHGGAFLQTFSLTQLANIASALAASGIADPAFLNVLAEQAALQLQEVSKIYQQCHWKESQATQEDGKQQQQQQKRDGDVLVASGTSQLSGF